MDQPILFDILLAAILLLFTYLGAKKGFVLTLCGLVAVLVALMGANIVSNAAAPMVADAIQPKIEQIIVEQLDKAIQHTEFISVSGDVAATAEEVPLAGVLEVLRDNQFYLGFMDSIEKALDEGVSGAAASAAARVAATIAAQLAKGIIFSVAFFLILILWSILSHALDLVTRLPGLNALNGALGGALGLVKGLIIAYVAVWVLYDLLGYVSLATAEKTYLFRFLLEHGPLALLSHT